MIALGKHAIFLQPCLHPAPKRRRRKKRRRKNTLNIYFCTENVNIPYQGSVWEKKRCQGSGKKNLLPHGNNKEHSPLPRTFPTKVMFKQNRSSKTKPKHRAEIRLTPCVKPREHQSHLYMNVYVYVQRMLCYFNHTELRSLSDVWTEGQMVSRVTSSKCVEGGWVFILTAFHLVLRKKAEQDNRHAGKQGDLSLG